MCKDSLGDSGGTVKETRDWGAVEFVGAVALNSSPGRGGSAKEVWCTRTLLDCGIRSC